MKILQSTYRLILLIVLCVIFHAKATAQHGKSMEIFSAEDTTELSESLKADPQDAQLSTQEKQEAEDSLKKAAYLIQRFKDMLAMKKDVLWADELSANIKAFEDSTFINIYPMAEIKGRGVMLGLINQLGSIIEGEPLEPFVRVMWSVNPVTEQKLPFKLSLRIEKSSAIPQEVIDEALKKIESGYKDKVYDEVTETENDIIWAMDILLLELGKKIGTSLAPKYLMKVNGKSYVSGKSIQQLATPPNSPDSLLTLQLINRIDSTDVESDVVWQGAMPGSYGEAYINLKYIADHHIKASVGSDVVFFTVNVWDGDIRRQLEGLLFAMLAEVLDEVLASIEKDLLQKQQELNDVKIRLQQEHEKNLEKRQDVQLDNILASTQPASDNMMFLSMNSTPVQQTAPQVEEKAIIGSYKVEAAKYALLLGLVNFARMNKYAIVDLMKPGNLNQFKQSLSTDIGRLSANVIVSLISGDKEGMKAFLATSISNKLNESTGR